MILATPKILQSPMNSPIDLSPKSSSRQGTTTGTLDGEHAPAPLTSISVSDAQQAARLYAAGHSLYCRAPAELEAVVVPRLLDEIGHGIKVCMHVCLCARIYVCVYV
jgi:hypothetical protein